MRECELHDHCMERTPLALKSQKSLLPNWSKKKFIYSKFFNFQKIRTPAKFSTGAKADCIPK